MATHNAATRNDAIKTAAIVLGAVFVLVGIWGFFQDPVLGLFEVSLLHNLVHLLSGAVLLGAAFANHGHYVRQTMLTLGAVYALVTLLGFLAPELTSNLLGAATNQPALNMADNWLHVLLTVALIGIPLAMRHSDPAANRGMRV